MRRIILAGFASVLLVAGISSVAVAGDGDGTISGGTTTINTVPAFSEPKTVDNDTNPVLLSKKNEVRGGAVLHKDKFYTKAEVDKIVKEKKSSGITPMNYPYEGGSGGFYFQRASCSYYFSSSTPDFCVSVYYNGQQNMAYGDHMGQFRGNYAQTYVEICRAGSNGVCYSRTQNVGFQSDTPSGGAGWYAWFAGPVYSGYSKATCIAAYGYMIWSGKTWRGQLSGFCG